MYGDPPIGAIKVNSQRYRSIIEFEEVHRARKGQEIIFSVKLDGPVFSPTRTYTVKDIQLSIDAVEEPTLVLVKDPPKPWWRFW